MNIADYRVGDIVTWGEAQVINNAGGELHRIEKFVIDELPPASTPVPPVKIGDRVNEVQSIAIYAAGGDCERVAEWIVTDVPLDLPAPRPISEELLKEIEAINRCGCLSCIKNSAMTVTELIAEIRACHTEIARLKEIAERKP